MFLSISDFISSIPPVVLVVFVLFLVITLLQRTLLEQRAGWNKMMNTILSAHCQLSTEVQRNTTS